MAEGVTAGAGAGAALGGASREAFEALLSSKDAQLARLEQPWNCPHGRPTMRHLGSLSMF